MTRFSVLALCGAIALSACTTSSEPKMGADGRPLPTVYRIQQSQYEKIPVRVQEGVNTLRAAKGLPALQLNQELFMAASMHSADMSKQNRPWHFGSDGSSPVLRAQRAGYRGRFQGELVSETFETEMETLAAWTGQDDTRAVIMDPAATDLGFSWWQDDNGKIWWTLLTGDARSAPIANITATALGQTVSSEVDSLVGQ